MTGETKPALFSLEYQAQQKRDAQVLQAMRVHVWTAAYAAVLPSVIRGSMITVAEQAAIAKRHADAAVAQFDIAKLV